MLLNVGVIYSDSLKDYSTAFKYFERASEKNKDNYFSVGWAYFNGKGVEKDVKKAFHYMKIAADNGNSIAQYFVALLYYQGLGTDKNIGEFEKMLTSSASKGNPKAKDLLDSYKRQKGSSTDISSSSVTCHYCGRTINKQNAYVRTELDLVQYYPSVLNNIRLAKSVGMSQADINALSASYKYADYFCSRRCAMYAGCRIME